jgi:hypothetical protein
MNRAHKALCLPAWANAWIEYLLDPQSGNRNRRRLPDRNSTKMPVGFAKLELAWGVLPQFYAIYAYEGRRYFQAVHRKWDVTNGVKLCRFWSAGDAMVTGLVLEFENGETLRSILVHPFRALYARMDPTYDRIDAEDDHVSLFVRQQLPDPKWRQTMIDRSLADGGAAV